MSRLFILAFFLVSAAFSVSAFAPSSLTKASVVTKTTANMGFGMGDGEQPKKLTRDNEPDEYFSSNLDKMSDSEKIPLALGGLVVISLPFIAGLIALYSAK